MNNDEIREIVEIVDALERKQLQRLEILDRWAEKLADLLERGEPIDETDEALYRECARFTAGTLSLVRLAAIVREAAEKPKSDDSMEGWSEYGFNMN